MINAIYLSKLPVPEVIETLDYEVILSEMVADLKAREPEYTNILESDPAYKVLEVAAYRELILRQRINDAAKSVMLAYAKGADLDNLGALFGVERQIIQVGNPDATPPTIDIFEDDERFRTRVVLALEGFTTAGSIGSYVFHTMSVSAEIKDVSVVSPTPGDVVVTLLSIHGNGTVTNELIDTVNAALNKEEVRPLTDFVTVQTATIQEYEVNAHVTFYSGLDVAFSADEAKKKVEETVENAHRLGYGITLPAIYAALHQEGVKRIDLAQPVADILTDAFTATFCTNINITWGHE